jgi:hypothetical protein
MLLCLGFLFSACTKNLTQKNLVYYNDFEEGNLKGIELYDFRGLLNTPKLEDYYGSKILGRFNNNAFRLVLTDLPEHNAVNVEFTIYIHDKWTGGATDIWQMMVENNPVLITSFSNTPLNKQAYPNYYLPGGGVPPKTSSQDSALLGVCSLKGIIGGTASYKIVKTFPHTDSKFTLQCNDALSPFEDFCLKSWSIDNISITAIKY